MPTITLTLDGITKRGVGKDELPKLVDRLGMSVEKMTADEITIEVTPNRPDLLEANGLARALRLLSGKATVRENHYALRGAPALKIVVGKGVRKCRPYIAGFVVKGADLKGSMVKELMNFQEKLHETYGRKRRKMAIGIYDLDKIEGDIVYDTAKSGKMRPLGSQREMTFDGVLAFAGQEDWSAIIKGYGTYPHVRDSKKVLSLVPVLNCEEAKVTEGTRDLFVEVTGTLWQTVDDTANILACLFVDSGAEVLPCSIEGGKVAATPTMKYREFKIAMRRIDRTLGVAFRPEDLITLAGQMGHMAARYGGRLLFVTPPYRTDVISERDVIEDIAIAYGYDGIAPLRVVGATVGVPDAIAEGSESASLALVGLGFSEAVNTYLTSEEQCFGKMRRDVEKESVVKVAYAKTETLSVLRDSVLPSLLGNLETSRQATMPQRLFEIGFVFSVEKGKAVERTKAALVSEHSRSNFSEIKGAVLEFLGAVGAPKPELRESRDGPFIEGRCASVIMAGKAVGVFGEIHPEVLANFSLEEPVAAAELNLEAILGAAEGQNGKG